MANINRSASRNPNLGLAVVCVAIFIMVIDNTVLNIALPALSRDLGASNSDLQWIVDAYTFVYSGILLTAGSLGDRFGRARSLWWGSAGFGIASATAAFANTTFLLIVARGAMGVFAAFVTPAGLSIVANLFTEPGERARGIAIWAAVASAGGAAGPPIGGILLDHFWWGSVFLVNVPLVVVILIAAPRCIPESKDPSPNKLDPIGALLSTLALVTLLWATIDAPTKGWTSTSTLTVAAVSVALLMAFLRWEMITPSPMIDLRFFTARVFAVSTSATCLTVFGGIGVNYMLSLMLQGVMGYSPLGAGLRLAPFAAINATMGIFSHQLCRWFGRRRVITTGLAAQAVCAATLLGIDRHTGYGTIFVIMMCFSGVQALAFAPTVGLAMSAVPREKATVASAVNSTMRQTSFAFGVAVIGSLLASGYRSRLASTGPDTGVDAATLTDASRSLSRAVQLSTELPSEQGTALAERAREAFMHGMHIGVYASIVASAIGALMCFLWLPSENDTAIGPVTTDASIAAH